MVRFVSTFPSRVWFKWVGCSYNGLLLYINGPIWFSLVSRLKTKELKLNRAYIYMYVFENSCLQPNFMYVTTCKCISDRKYQRNQ